MLKTAQILSLAISLVATNTVLAQQNFTLHNSFKWVPQRAYTNPAFIPKAKINVAIPVLGSIYAGGGNSGFAWTELYKRRSDDSTYFDFKTVIDGLQDENFAGFNVETDLLHVGIRFLGKNYLSFNMTEHLRLNFRYPKDFFELGWYGNYPYIGDTLLFNFGIDLIHYREYSLAYAREFGKKLTIGLKAKLLQGMANIWTERADVKMYQDTASNFPVTLSSDIILRSSGILDSNSFGNSFDVGNYLFGKSNFGVGFDIGATFKLNKKIALSASIIDLGFITWKQENVTIQSAEPGANLTYRGLPFSEYIRNNETEIHDATDKIADTLSRRFQLDTVYGGEYTNPLIAKFYLGGTYTFSDMHEVGATVFGQFFNNNAFPAFSINYAFTFKKWLTAAVSYNMYNNTYTNFGLGLRLNGGFFQFYMVTDNIIGLFVPQDFRFTNFRMGMNLTFGRKDDPKSKSHTKDTTVF